MQQKVSYFCELFVRVNKRIAALFRGIVGKILTHPVSTTYGQSATARRTTACCA